MRRRLEQLLNGRFEYEVPHLLLSETEVALTLDEGQNFRGELNIGAEDGRRVKGIVTRERLENRCFPEFPEKTGKNFSDYAS